MARGLCSALSKEAYEARVKKAKKQAEDIISGMLDSKNGLRKVGRYLSDIVSDYDVFAPDILDDECLLFYKNWHIENLKSAIKNEKHFFNQKNSCEFAIDNLIILFRERKWFDFMECLKTLFDECMQEVDKNNYELTSAGKKTLENILKGWDKLAYHISLDWRKERSNSFATDSIKYISEQYIFWLNDLHQDPAPGSLRKNRDQISNLVARHITSLRCWNSDELLDWTLCKDIHEDIRLIIRKCRVSAAGMLKEEMEASQLKASGLPLMKTKEEKESLSNYVEIYGNIKRAADELALGIAKEMGDQQKKVTTTVTWCFESGWKISVNYNTTYINETKALIRDITLSTANLDFNKKLLLLNSGPQTLNYTTELFLDGKKTEWIY